MYYNIAKPILQPTLETLHLKVSNATNLAQKFINKNNNIGLAPIKPKLNQDRIDGLINRISSEEKFEEVSWMLDEPIKNFAQSIVDSAVKDNVEFQYSVGLRPKVIRKLAGNCCDWCSEVDGVYAYPNVPKDVFRRHRYCRCTVEYDPGVGRRQNVHTKKWKENKNGYLQERLDFIDEKTNQQLFIPSKSIILSQHTIATGNEIRDIKRLITLYGGVEEGWDKKVGKVVSQLYIHDVYWYENSGRQYEMKMKTRSRK